MNEWDKWACVSSYTALPTFFERAQVEGLPDGEDGLDEDAHAALGRVDASDHAEGMQYIWISTDF